MSMSENLIVAFVLVVLIYYYVQHLWKNRWLYYYGLQFEGPLSLPIIGICYYLILGADIAILNYVLRFANKYKGPFIKFWIGNHLCILPKEPKHIEILLKNHLEKPPLYEPTKMLLQNGLATAPVEIWKFHRKIINQTMNQNILNSFVEIFAKHSNKLVDELQGKYDKGHIDLLPIIFQSTINIICETTMDIKPDHLDEQTQVTSYLFRLQEMITPLVLKPWTSLMWNFTSAKEFSLKIRKIEEFVTKIIQMKRLEKNQSESKKKYLLNYLINLENEKLTDHEIFEETKAMLVTGSETTALTENYVILMLAMHPEIQENVYREISEILINSDTVTPQDLSQMDYLERVIKETMRLFSLVPLIARFLQKKVELDSYVLPGESTIVIPIIYLHKNPKIWPEPLKFNPDRFLPEEIAKRPSGSYIPFSAGPRNCLGLQYAMMSMKVLLALLIKQFKISTTQYKTISDVKLEYAITIKPKHGFKIILEGRE